MTWKGHNQETSTSTKVQPAVPDIIVFLSTNTDAKPTSAIQRKEESDIKMNSESDESDTSGDQSDKIV